MIDGLGRRRSSAKLVGVVVVIFPFPRGGGRRRRERGRGEEEASRQLRWSIGFSLCTCLSLSPRRDSAASEWVLARGVGGGGCGVKGRRNQGTRGAACAARTRVRGSRQHSSRRRAGRSRRAQPSREPARHVPHQQ
eukprot:scaffold11158_cov32-Tisochrysis_lutea.AAC.3